MESINMYEFQTIWTSLLTKMYAFVTQTRESNFAPKWHMLSHKMGAYITFYRQNQCLLTVASAHNSPLVAWCQRGWSAGSHRAQYDPGYGSSSGAPVRRQWSGGSCPARSPPVGREHRGRCRGVWCHHQWLAHSETGSAEHSGANTGAPLLNCLLEQAVTWCL